MARAFYLLVVLMVCGLCYGQEPVTFYVGIPGGYDTIQEAIDDSTNNPICVYSGTYTENIDFKGKNIKVYSNSGPSSTIIDGGQNGSVVTIDSGENLRAILEGFTITNGTGTGIMVGGYGWMVGGGIYCHESSCVVKECWITGNDVSPSYPYLTCIGGGGFFYATAGASSGDRIGLKIQDCKIYSNTSNQWAAGIDVEWYKDVYFERNEIYDNRNDSTSDEGIVEFVGTDFASCDRNRVHNNYYCKDSIRFYGYSSYSDDLLVTNLAVYDNEDEYGNYRPNEGMLVEQYANIDLINCTFHEAGNLRGADVKSLSGGTADFYNCIFWQSNYSSGYELELTYATSNFNYCCIYGGSSSILVNGSASLTYGGNNRTDDPSLTSDMHIASNSTSKDAGDKTVSGLPTYDIDGQMRVANGEVDIGVDEIH